MTGGLFVVLLLALLVLIMIGKTAVVVPQQSAYVVERLGKYAATLDAGFHILVPFIDRIRYKHSLKETDRKSTRLNSSHGKLSRMPSSA